jgi:hypothetical protein
MLHNFITCLGELFAQINTWYNLSHRFLKLSLEGQIFHACHVSETLVSAALKDVTITFQQFLVFSTILNHFGAKIHVTEM